MWKWCSHAQVRCVHLCTFCAEHENLPHFAKSLREPEPYGTKGNTFHIIIVSATKWWHNKKMHFSNEQIFTNILRLYIKCNVNVQSWLTWIQVIVWLSRGRLSLEWYRFHHNDEQNDIIWTDPNPCPVHTDPSMWSTISKEIRFFLCQSTLTSWAGGKFCGLRNKVRIRGIKIHLWDKARRFFASREDLTGCCILVSAIFYSIVQSFHHSKRRTGRDRIKLILNLISRDGCVIYWLRTKTKLVAKSGQQQRELNWVMYKAGIETYKVTTPHGKHWCNKFIYKVVTYSELLRCHTHDSIFGLLCNLWVKVCGNNGYGLCCVTPISPQRDPSLSELF